MKNNQFPDLFEIEYSFNSGGHNTIKFMDGRLFFFSEADSDLSEKNEYLTKVSVPKNGKWEHFWEDTNRIGIWDWDDDYRPEEDVPAEGDIWQVKIKRGEETIYSKSWCLGPESMDEFFKAVQKLVGVDITMPFVTLSKRLARE